jgi:hypothetical protein
MSDSRSSKIKIRDTYVRPSSGHIYDSHIVVGSVVDATVDKISTGYCIQYNSNQYCRTVVDAVHEHYHPS